MLERHRPPRVLFEHAGGWLIGHKVLLPGVSILERFVSEVRSQMEARLRRLCAAGQRQNPTRPLAAALIARLARERLTIHADQAQVLPVDSGDPWLGLVVYPTHRRLKRRLAINFTRRLAGLLADYRAGRIPFADLDASVQGWINHVRYADTLGLREHLFSTHPIRPGGE